MHSWLVWLIFAVACGVLGFVGYHFAVRTLRFVTAFFALAVVVVVTRYGVAHLGTGKHADLVNSFTQGFDALSQAFFRPLLGHNNPIPGGIGWLVIIGLLVFGYRELEVWAMFWQPPTVDLSALGGDQQGTQNGGASDGQDKAATDRRHDEVANELRFRLPAVAVKAPATLPGGTRVAGLVSIAESTGNTVGGLAGAIIDFVGTLWPDPRRYQVRIRVERGDKRHAAGSVTVTVDLEDSGTGESIVTKTLSGRQLDEAACAVAGYVARQIFSADPTAPPWCYGKSDGSDLAALLTAWQDRVYPKSPRDIPEARIRQMEILERGVSSSVCAGVARYELAQLYDISGFQVEALRLHALNREQYPRFYRGRYRLGMSLEMIASRDFELQGRKAKETLRECLDILGRCRVTRRYEDGDRDIESIKLGEPLPRSLRMDLLTAAQVELCAVRRQLNACRLIWAAFAHRDERTIWKHYWQLAERERFHDSARVAELLVAVRRKLIEKEECGRAGESSGQGPSAVMDRHNRVMNRYNRARAEWIAAAITGDKKTIKAVLNHRKNKSQAADDTQPRPHAQRTRWLFWQLSTPSWQAAYNTACLYAALAHEYDERASARERKHHEEKMTQRVVTSLMRAVNDRHCEMGHPSDWISKDPDFNYVRKIKKFNDFCIQLSERDHQNVKSAPAHR